MGSRIDVWLGRRNEIRKIGIGVVIFPMTKTTYKAALDPLRVTNINTCRHRLMSCLFYVIVACTYSLPFRLLVLTHAAPLKGDSTSFESRDLDLVSKLSFEHRPSSPVVDVYSTSSVVAPQFGQALLWHYCHSAPMGGTYSWCVFLVSPGDIYLHLHDVNVTRKVSLCDQILKMGYANITSAYCTSQPEGCVFTADVATVEGILPQVPLLLDVQYHFRSTDDHFPTRNSEPLPDPPEVALNGCLRVRSTHTLQSTSTDALLQSREWYLRSRNVTLEELASQATSTQFDESNEFTPFNRIGIRDKYAQFAAGRRVVNYDGFQTRASISYVDLATAPFSHSPQCLEAISRRRRVCVYSRPSESTATPTGAEVGNDEPDGSTSPTVAVDSGDDTGQARLVSETVLVDIVWYSKMEVDLPYQVTQASYGVVVKRTDVADFMLTCGFLDCVVTEQPYSFSPVSNTTYRQRRDDANGGEGSRLPDHSDAATQFVLHSALWSTELTRVTMPAPWVDPGKSNWGCDVVCYVTMPNGTLVLWYPTTVMSGNVEHPFSIRMVTAQLPHFETGAMLGDAGDSSLRYMDAYYTVSSYITFYCSTSTLHLHLHNHSNLSTCLHSAKEVSDNSSSIASLGPTTPVTGVDGIFGTLHIWNAGTYARVQLLVWHPSVATLGGFPLYTNPMTTTVASQLGEVDVDLTVLPRILDIDGTSPQEGNFGTHYIVLHPLSSMSVSHRVYKPSYRRRQRHVDLIVGSALVPVDDRTTDPSSWVVRSRLWVLTFVSVSLAICICVIIASTFKQTIDGTRRRCQMHELVNVTRSGYSRADSESQTNSSDTSDVEMIS